MHTFTSCILTDQTHKKLSCTYHRAQRFDNYWLSDSTLLYKRVKLQASLNVITTTLSLECQRQCQLHANVNASRHPAQDDVCTVMKLWPCVWLISAAINPAA